MDSKFIKVVDESGIEKQAEVVLCFSLEEKNFVIYTFNEEDDNGMIILYSSMISKDDSKVTFEKISPTDWTTVKQVMNKIVKEWEEK